MLILSLLRVYYYNVNSSRHLTCSITKTTFETDSHMSGTFDFASFRFELLVFVTHSFRIFFDARCTSSDFTVFLPA